MNETTNQGWPSGHALNTKKLKKTHLKKIYIYKNFLTVILSYKLSIHSKLISNRSFYLNIKTSLSCKSHIFGKFKIGI